MSRSHVRSTSTALAAGAVCLVLGAWWAHSPRALGGDPVSPGGSIRMLALNEKGSAILIDQSNRAWIITQGALRAAPVLNDSNQQILIR